MKTIFKPLGFFFVLSLFMSCSHQPYQYDLLCDNSFPKIDSGVIVLSLHQQNCDACDYTLQDSNFLKNNLPKINLDIMENRDNKLISQALWNYALPTNYFINANYEIIGITLGIKEFVKYADSICKFNIRYHNNEMVRYKVEKDSILPLLSYSLKALHSYSCGKMTEAKTQALASLQRGSYFFSNYLLYKIYKGENQKDSIEFYKKAALRHNEPVDNYIYNDLIDELNETH